MDTSTNTNAIIGDSMIKGLRRDPLSRVAKRRRVTFGDGSPGAAVGCLAKLYLMLVQPFFKSFAQQIVDLRNLISSSSPEKKSRLNYRIQGRLFTSH